MGKGKCVKPLDRFLQRWRILKAKPFIPVGSRLLDVGCADGFLYKKYSSRIADYVGIDPILKSSTRHENYQLIAGRYPNDLPKGPPFDVITMLAVVEHLSEALQEQLAAAIFHDLAPKGRLIVTTPSPRVDPMLHVMKRIKIIDGMALEEHNAFEPIHVPRIFAELELILHRRSQLGLNHLFVFQRN